METKCKTSNISISISIFSFVFLFISLFVLFGCACDEFEYQTRLASGSQDGTLSSDYLTRQRQFDERRKSEYQRSQSNSLGVSRLEEYYESLFKRYFTGDPEARRLVDSIMGIKSGTKKDLASKPIDYIYEKADIMPSFYNGTFLDGRTALSDFIKKNLVYSENALKDSINGTVYMTFIVEKDGAISNIQVLVGLGSDCNEASVQLVKKMPKWIPGKIDGNPVRVQVYFQVHFPPENNN